MTLKSSNWSSVSVPISRSSRSRSRRRWRSSWRVLESRLPGGGMLPGECQNRSCHGVAGRTRLRTKAAGGPSVTELSPVVYEYASDARPWSSTHLRVRRLEVLRTPTTGVPRRAILTTRGTRISTRRPRSESRTAPIHHARLIAPARPDRPHLRAPIRHHPPDD